MVLHSAAVYLNYKGCQNLGLTLVQNFDSRGVTVTPLPCKPAYKLCDSGANGWKRVPALGPYQKSDSVESQLRSYD